MTPIQTFAFLLAKEPYKFKNNIDVCQYLLFSSSNEYDWDGKGELSLLYPVINYNFKEIKNESIKNLKKYKWFKVGSNFYEKMLFKINEAENIAREPLLINSYSFVIPDNFNTCNISCLPENISKEWLNLIKQLVIILRQKLNNRLNECEFDNSGISKLFLELAYIENRISFIEHFQSKTNISFETFILEKNLKSIENVGSYL